MMGSLQDKDFAVALQLIHECVCLLTCTIIFNQINKKLCSADLACKVSKLKSLVCFYSAKTPNHDTLYCFHTIHELQRELNCIVKKSAATSTRAEQASMFPLQLFITD